MSQFLLFITSFFPLLLFDLSQVMMTSAEVRQHHMSNVLLSMFNVKCFCCRKLIGFHFLRISLKIICVICMEDVEFKGCSRRNWKSSRRHSKTALYWWFVSFVSMVANLEKLHSIFDISTIQWTLSSLWLVQYYCMQFVNPLIHILLGIVMIFWI